MRRNSTSLNSCQHDDINIVTVSVARRCWTAPLKERRPCVKHFTTFYALAKHDLPKGDYFTPKGHFCAHWCEKRQFSLSVNGAQTRVLHACVKKDKFTMLYGNHCYIFIENFPQKFSPCIIQLETLGETLGERDKSRRDPRQESSRDSRGDFWQYFWRDFSRFSSVSDWIKCMTLSKTLRESFFYAGTLLH